MAARYVIIGGGIAGTTAAETIRKRDPEGEVTIVSDEPHRLYSRIMLSKPGWFTGEIPFDNIWLRKPEWYAENGIALLAGKKAVELDHGNRRVVLDDGASLEYDKLLLAVGTCPRRWGVPGADKSGVMYLRTLEDGKRIMEAAKTARAAVIIGGGAIGFETCELLLKMGMTVTFVIREGHYWDPVLDATAGRLIEDSLERNGVTLIKNMLVREAVGGESLDGVLLEDGSKIGCDIVIVGIGGVCEIDTFRKVGVLIEHGIRANEFLETNLPDVWTAGDSAEAYDVMSEEPVMYGSWNNAQQQGRTAGINMTGGKEEYHFVSTYTVRGFGITLCFVGNIAPHEDRQMIVRLSPDGRSYGRLVMKDGRIVGATFIDRTAEMGPVSKLIAAKTDLSSRLAQLSDPAFDLTTLLA